MYKEINIFKVALCLFSAHVQGTLYTIIVLYIITTYLVLCRYCSNICKVLLKYMIYLEKNQQ